MKPLLNQAIYLFVSCHSGKRSIVFILCILLLSTSLFSGCGSSKKTIVPATKTDTPTPSVTTPIAEQAVEAEIKNSTLMVTFSTSNDLLKHYPHFKLGLFDIIVHVRSGDTLYKQSLYDLDPVSEEEYTKAIPLELTHLKKDSYLYHGFFNVPAGTLESVKVQFSGAKSSIALGDEVPALIDAFFFSYTEGDARLPARSYPAEVTTFVPAGFALTEDKMEMLCIDVDMNLSVGTEPLMHSDPEQKYGLFVPTISAKLMGLDFDMTIRQSDLLTMKDGNMGMGDPDGALFTSVYTVSESATLSMNADSVTDLNGVSGLYAIDMMGRFSSSAGGHSYVINNASMLSMAEDSTAVRYEGKITVSGDSMALKGHQSSLNIDESSVNGSEYFSGDIVGNPSDLNLAEGDMAVIWSDGVISKVVMRHDAPEAAESKEVFELRSTVSITPADILAIKSAGKDEAYVTLTLPESLDCADYITNISTSAAKMCDRALTAIEISRANTGMFTLVETRKGIFQTAEEAQTEGEEKAEESQLSELVLESDIVHHFATADEFFSVLEAKVATEGYRLAVMTAEGSVDGTTFKMGDTAKAIILQPHPLLDDDADGWVAGLGSGGPDVLASTNKGSIALYTGLALGGAVVAVLGGYLAKKIVEYTQTKDLGVKLKFIEVDNVNIPNDFYVIESDAKRRFSLETAEGIKVKKFTNEEGGSLGAIFVNDQDEIVRADGTKIENDTEKLKGTKIINFDGTPIDGFKIAPEASGDGRTLKALFNQQVADQIKIIKHKPVIAEEKGFGYSFDDGAEKELISKVTFDVDGETKTIKFINKKATISSGPDGIKIRAVSQGIFLPATLLSFNAEGTVIDSSKYRNVKIFGASSDIDITEKITHKMEADKEAASIAINEAKKIRLEQAGGVQKKFDPRKVFSDVTKVYVAAASEVHKAAKANNAGVKVKWATRVSDWFAKFRRKKMAMR